MTKVCPSCGVEKDESQFGKHKNRKDGLQVYCKDCMKQHLSEYYKQHKDEIKVKTKSYAKEHREIYRSANRKLYDTRKEWFSKQRTLCAKCGDNREYVIHFHHIDPNEKLFTLSMQSGKRPMEALESERKKCICLCSNCHMEFHHFYGSKPNNPIEDLTEYLGRNPYEI